MVDERNDVSDASHAVVDMVDQRNGKPSDRKRLRERDVLHKHQVSVLGHRQHSRHESKSSETY